MARRDDTGSGAPSSSRLSVEFRVENETYPFVGASAVESCTFELEEMIPRGDGVYSEFFRIDGADTDRILGIAEETPQVEPTLLREDGDVSLFEFEVAGGCIAVSLADVGAYPRVVRGESGDGRVVADFPRGEGRSLVRQILDTHEGVDVVTRDGSARTLPSFEHSDIFRKSHDVLTEHQRRVLATAVSEGFYAWPRETTLTELARLMDVDEAVLDVRLHNAEQTVLAALFEDGTLDEVAEPTHPFIDASGADAETD
ncbi:bacterio-opsin activator domain-containing protein [Halarchaeum sp. P4]|uniref:bacterio-opsin activator domain-containing protein n=1 Tax=Halarchaeum sp. P4 TaxID=3421639 RepID=UPI003EC04422